VITGRVGGRRGEPVNIAGRLVHAALDDGNVRSVLHQSREAEGGGAKAHLSGRGYDLEGGA